MGRKPSLGASSVGRRIHDNSVIMISTADFPLHEFDAVVYNPADGGLRKAGGAGVFLSPGHHALGGVYMGYMGAGLGGCQRGASRVGEQVQHLNGASGLSDFIAKPVPRSEERRVGKECRL